MIARTFDYRIVQELLGEDREEGALVVSSKIFYLLCGKGLSSEKGLIMFVPVKDGLQIHMKLPKEMRGKRAAEAGLAALAWIKEHTPIRTIYAAIQKTRRDVAFLAVHCGLTRYVEEKKFEGFDYFKKELR
jgi:hypothetical protein